MTPKRKKNEGSIEFSLCADIKQKTKNSKIIDVSSGDIVIFPSMVVPLFVGREKSIRALQEVMKTDKSIVLSAQKNSEVDEPEDNWDHIMDINLKPMFLMSKYAIPEMIKSGNGGSIVNISSISATRPRGYTTYSASKGAVLSLSQAMAVDHGADGIRVNCILPGPVYTPMVYSSGMTKQHRSQRQNASLIQIEGDGWDIGKAVVYLSSSWARYITGHLMVVDGGCSLSSRPRG